MNKLGEHRSPVAWVAVGLIGGIACVVACGGPDRADAGASDSGVSSGCCDTCACTISDPLTLQGTVDVNVTNTTPVDVTVTNMLAVASPPRPIFLGVTTAVFDGTGGYSTMNASCNLEYAGSRMCSTTVILDSYPAPEPLADAWVWSRIVATAPTLSLNEIGQASSGNANTGNCSSPTGSAFGYVSGYYDGTMITAAGDLQLTVCNTTMPVACCGFAP